MEIAIISGKGGTGKSIISAAFATLSQKVILADCDVDAANLYLIFNPLIEEEQVYISGQKAILKLSVCTHCGLCIDYCRFDAISFKEKKIEISDILCDGCKLCSRICPENAILMIDEDKSRMYAGSFRNGKMVYGRLAPGEENSGKLVSMVRDRAKKMAIEAQLNTIIIDGPPGIGCSAISTITGVDHVVIVTEPSISGFKDLERTIQMASKFDVKIWVIINKYDLNVENATLIESYCNNHNIDVIAKMPFDKQIVKAMVQCKSIIEYAPESNTSKLIEEAYRIITA